MPYIIVFILLVIVPKIFTYQMKKNFNKSNYKNESGNTYEEAIKDKGKYDEYLTFKVLEDLNKESRIRTNVYLPKNDKETTEVDLIYIDESGIYVIESKNYSGRIFGDEKSKYWTQMLNKNTKELFYNPIMQNKTHIKYLAKLLDIDEKYITSIIVFSRRCKLKKAKVYSDNIKVINRSDLKATMEKIINNKDKVFEMGRVIELYCNLKPYTCVSDNKKLKHIENINRNLQNKKCNNII